MTGIWPRAPHRFRHAGPMARSIRDLALAFSQLSGPDGYDAFSTSTAQFDAGVGRQPHRRSAGFRSSPGRPPNVWRRSSSPPEADGTAPARSRTTIWPPPTASLCLRSGCVEGAETRRGDASIGVAAAGFREDRSSLKHVAAERFSRRGASRRGVRSATPVCCAPQLLHLPVGHDPYRIEETGTTLRSSYGTAWQPPSLYERFDPCYGRADLRLSYELTDAVTLHGRAGGRVGATVSRPAASMRNTMPTPAPHTAGREPCLPSNTPLAST
ncbi:hypothetical protein J2849_004148 [Azospirillum melinis]|nr:hypothetical protein [Azospirillum melinis]MBP2307736.1 hypothetical protein [Azospirillum melinis]